MGTPTRKRRRVHCALFKDSPREDLSSYFLVVGKCMSVRAGRVGRGDLSDIGCGNQDRTQGDQEDCDNTPCDEPFAQEQVASCRDATITQAQ